MIWIEEGFGGIVECCGIFTINVNQQRTDRDGEKRERMQELSLLLLIKINLG